MRDDGGGGVRGGGEVKPHNNSLLQILLKVSLEVDIFIEISNYGFRKEFEREAGRVRKKVVEFEDLNLIISNVISCYKAFK